MDYQTVLYYVFGLVSISYIVHLGFYMSGASFYDIWQFWRGRLLRDLDADNSYRPFVTVLVPAHNEQEVIIRCLESIRTSTYKHIQIIVVDDASTDRTYYLVRRYAREHPDVQLRVIRKRINAGKGTALNYALKHYAAGSLVMMLDADSVLSKFAIARAVSYFKDPSIAGVAANVQLMNHFTILGVLQKFEHMIGYRSKKAYSLTNCEFVIGGVASTYRMDVLRAVGFYDTDTVTEDISLSMKIIAQGNRAYRILYGVDVMAMTEPVNNFPALLRQRFRWKYGSLQNIMKHHDLIGRSDMQYTRMLTLYRIPMAIMSEIMILLMPLVLIYVLYITFSQGTLYLLLGAYTTITVYVLITLWQDEHIFGRDRWHLTMYVPAAYFLFLLMDIVQFVAVVRCLSRLGLLLRHKNVGTTWVSPERLGGEVAVGKLDV